MKALLALEDGFRLEGESFTGPIELGGGEVIFNTAMTGYQELITDPSCAGQMLCMTWPLIGNYGVNPDDMESAAPQLSALLVKECCKEPSHWQATESLPEFLTRHGVPGVEGLDTRALTLHLRNHGTMRGCISTSILDPAALAAKARQVPAMEGRKPAPEAAPAAPYIWDAKAAHGGRPAPASLGADGSYAWPSGADKGTPRVLVYDFGVRWSLVRMLASQGMDLLMAPPSFSFEQAKAVNPEAVFLSGGPGDPAALAEESAVIAKLAEDWPVAGCGLGYQALALALGGKSARLKFGHHGSHPVRNLITGKIEISSQNHGFHILMDGVHPTHINLNDQTLEGFRHPDKAIIAVQHHPETASGFTDGKSFLACFKDMVLEKMNQK